MTISVTLDNRVDRTEISRANLLCAVDFTNGMLVTQSQHPMRSNKGGLMIKNTLKLRMCMIKDITTTTGTWSQITKNGSGFH